jgi:hypothetical protein
MKIQIIQEDGGYNAIFLESGETAFFEPSEYVTLPRSAKLIIE